MGCISTDKLQEMHRVPVQQYEVQVLTGTYHLLVALNVNIDQFELRIDPTLGETLKVRIVWWVQGAEPLRINPALSVPLVVRMICWVQDAEPFPLVVRTQCDAVITLCRSKSIAQRPSFDPDTRAMRPIGRLKVK